VQLRSRAERFVAVAGLLASAAWPTIASAEPAEKPAANSEDRTRMAGERFATGRAAFVRGDFRLAGESFDAAFALAPHHDALWNSAQAWESAGELARAANRYSRYLSLAPANAPDRAQATNALASIARKLGRVHVVAQASDDPRIDGEPIASEEIYVYPGTHELTIRRDGALVTREVSVAAREDRSVSFGAAAAPPSAEQPAPKAERPNPLPPSRDSGLSEKTAHGISPWFVVGGGALTVVSGALTGYFGARAVDQKHQFDRAPSASLLDDGRQNQTLANVGIGVTIGLAALTTCVALFFVDWSGGASTKTTSSAMADLAALRVRFP
jgi:tetratricopeptide (TPR) repeat protein